jgi:hypothetical protein
MFVESWFWGEVFNVISSAGWVFVAYLAYTLPNEPSLGDLLRYWISYGALTILSSTVMFTSNWLYCTGYRTVRTPLLSLADMTLYPEHYIPNIRIALMSCKIDRILNESAHAASPASSSFGRCLWTLLAEHATSLALPGFCGTT